MSGSRHQAEVSEWFDASENPKKEVMQAVRNVILGADPRIEECIKWKCPTFAYKGNLVSLQPNAKRFASLMFHRGATIPGDHPKLEGSSKLVRTMKFESVDEVEQGRADLVAVVRAWCEMKDA